VEYQCRSSAEANIEGLLTPCYRPPGFELLRFDLEPDWMRDELILALSLYTTEEGRRAAVRRLDSVKDHRQPWESEIRIGPRAFVWRELC